MQCQSAVTLGGSIPRKTGPKITHQSETDGTSSIFTNTTANRPPLKFTYNSTKVGRFHGSHRPFKTYDFMDTLQIIEHGST